MTSPSPMKSPDRDAADDLIVRLETFQRAAVTQQAHDLFREAASELATLRRRVAELEAHKTAMPVSGGSMYCGKCNQWLADGRRLLWHPASGKCYCIGCDPLSPPTRKE